MDCFTVLMEHRVTVLGSVFTKNGDGLNVQTWSTTRQTGVACLVNAPLLTDTDRQAQDNLVGTVTVATFYAGVQRGDKLVVEVGGPYAGAELHVTGVKKQPGVSFLGFSDLYHVTAEHVA